jgi:hypothetical protein
VSTGRAARIPSCRRELKVAIKLSRQSAEKVFEVPFVLRIPVVRGLVWWLADRGLFRATLEEAVKQSMIRSQERAAVITLPGPAPATDSYSIDDGRRAAGTEGSH